MAADLLYLAIEMKKTTNEGDVDLSGYHSALQGVVGIVALIVAVMVVWMGIYANLYVFTKDIFHTFPNLRYMLGVTGIVAMVLLLILLPVLISSQIYFEKIFKKVIG